jgi:hypothetical protein
MLNRYHPSSSMISPTYSMSSAIMILMYFQASAMLSANVPGRYFKRKSLARRSVS